VPVGNDCPHCNQAAKSKKSTFTDERKSWQQDSAYDGTDIPDDEFAYDTFIANEFGKNPIRKSSLAWYWYLVAVFLLFVMFDDLFR
jgi:hypothetical protein